MIAAFLNKYVVFFYFFSLFNDQLFAFFDLLFANLDLKFLQLYLFGNGVKFSVVPNVLLLFRVLLD
jgi:hypothetical protein